MYFGIYHKLQNGQIYPFDEVAQENIETLNKRYPNGFNPAN